MNDTYDLNAGTVIDFLRPQTQVAVPVRVPDVSANRKLLKEMIAPAITDVERELVEEHAAEPIKDVKYIIRVSEYLIQKKRYKDIEIT